MEDQNNLINQLDSFIFNVQQLCNIHSFQVHMECLLKESMLNSIYFNEYNQSIFSDLCRISYLLENTKYLEIKQITHG